MMRVAMRVFHVKQDGKEFDSYSVTDKNGTKLNVRFTKNAVGKKPSKSSYVDIDEATAFITKPDEKGYETLVINGNFTVGEEYVVEHEPLDTSRFE